MHCWGKMGTSPKYQSFWEFSKVSELFVGPWLSGLDALCFAGIKSLDEKVERSKLDSFWVLSLFCSSAVTEDLAIKKGLSFACFNLMIIESSSNLVSSRILCLLDCLYVSALGVTSHSK